MYAPNDETENAAFLLDIEASMKAAPKVDNCPDGNFSTHMENDSATPKRGGFLGKEWRFRTGNSEEQLQRNSKMNSNYEDLLSVQEHPQIHLVLKVNYQLRPSAEVYKDVRVKRRVLVSNSVVYELGLVRTEPKPQ